LLAGWLPALCNGFDCVQGEREHSPPLAVGAPGGTTVEPVEPKCRNSATSRCHSGSLAITGPHSVPARNWRWPLAFCRCCSLSMIPAQMASGRLTCRGLLVQVQYRPPLHLRFGAGLARGISLPRQSSIWTGGAAKGREQPQSWGPSGAVNTAGMRTAKAGRGIRLATLWSPIGSPRPPVPAATAESSDQGPSRFSD
jgi:hypothetical protein